MWFTEKFTKKFSYSYVDDEDKQKLVGQQWSDPGENENENENAGSEDCEVAFSHRVKRRRLLRPYIRCNTAGCICLVLLYVCTILATVIGNMVVQSHGNYFLRMTSSYSPILEKLQIPLVRTQIGATIAPDPDNPDHVYRLPPSPQVDKAWDRISHLGLVALTKSEVERMGKNATECTKTEPDWESDTDTYITQINVFHQLHCLNMLRKTNILYYDYYYGREYGYEPPMNFASHNDHCIDILRQNIMCNSDTEMLTFNWRRTLPRPLPDSGVRRLCRDFEAIAKWQEEVEIPEYPGRWKGMVRPAEAVDLPVPSELTDMVPTSYSADGRELQKLPNITRPDDCPSPSVERE